MTQMNLPVKYKQTTNTEIRLVVANGEEVGGGMEWEVGVSRCKLLCIEWINTKVLLCSTENYIHYPMINHNREYFKEHIYMCVYN